MSGKPKVLIKKIKNNLKFFKNKYSEILIVGISGPQDEWLRDNYYLLNRETERVLKDIGSADGITVESSNALMYKIVFSVISKLHTDFASEIKKKLSQYKERLSIADLELCEAFTVAAYSELCREAFIKDDPYLIEKGVKGIRHIGLINFDELADEYSAIEEIFRKDPAGAYPKMSKESRAYYRKQCGELARIKKCSEKEVALHALNEALKAENQRERHIGYYIIENNEKRKGRKVRAKVYIILRTVLPLAIGVTTGLILKRPFLFIPLYLPLFEIIRPVIEDLIMRKVDPFLIPKYDKNTEEVKNAKTVIVVSSLVPRIEKIPEISDHLVSLIERNNEKNTKLCLLADLRESDVKTRPEDASEIRALKKEIERLNKKFGNKFILAVRERSYIETQGSYAGKERKRGAIMSLACYCKGENERFEALLDPDDFLHKADYFIALDSDTQLLLGSVSDMVSAAVHPLNKPVIGINNIVTHGYGILAPKIGTDIKSAGKTAFSRLMNGTGGITVYDTICGNIYQDIFGQSVFAGKGLIDIDVFYQVLKYAFPDETVLSHDILEGGFLRCGFLSDIEITDGCPSNFNGWSKRLHRWIRGDFQNIKWIFGRIPVKNGTEDNPLPYAQKFFITDNVVRERAAASPLFLFFSCMIKPEFAWLFVTAAVLSAFSANLYSASKSLFVGGFQMLSRKYYSDVATDTLHELKKGVFSVLTSFYTSCLIVDALARGLFRVFISKKHLLEWVTAADFENNKDPDLLQTVFNQGICVIAAALLFIFGNMPMIIYGLIIISSPFVSFYVSRKKIRNPIEIGEKERTKLLSYAAESWRYYAENCTEDENWLPPDNIQESPVKSVAHRTSPTNIGLYLLSVLAASDFGFIDMEETVKRVEDTLTTVEKLEKYHGNLLNWYDTQSLATLQPKYCSTVDSGNFLCCIHALKNGLTVKGVSPELIKRIDRIENSADLAVLYDNERKLFHIGYDLSKKQLSESYYDLLMSEARATSYYAIAKCRIDKKHWGKLGRTLAKLDNYTGSVSWTGTMFEYFMPQIFLPVYKDTLSYEALRFCLYCQRKRGIKLSKPWGCSESAYYAFDNQLNYQYKAHGIQKLGLCRNLGNDYVVSPYSSFLTLMLSPTASLENLSVMEQTLSVRGRYGFYESVDFTKRRVGNKPEVIRSYMAHHIGMSICSIDNCLNDNIIQKRFMSGEMRRASELLEEKIPVGAFVFEDIIRNDRDERPSRYVSPNSTFSKIFPEKPRCMMISNSRLGLYASDNGTGYITFDNLLVTRKSDDILRNPQGIFFSVEDGKKRFCVSAAPDFASYADKRCEFSNKYIAYYAESGELQAGLQETVLESVNAVKFKILLKNKTASKKRITLSSYFEPCMSDFMQSKAHRAFNALFVSAECIDTKLVFSRKIRSNEKNISAVCGFLTEGSFEYELNRERLSDRFTGAAGILNSKKQYSNPQNGAPDPCMAAKLSFEIEPRSQKTAEFLLCVDESKEKALENFDYIADKANKPLIKNSASPFYDTSLEGRIFGAVLPVIMYDSADGETTGISAQKNVLGIEALWKQGISGDIPLILLDYDSEDNDLYLRAVIRILKRAKGIFLKFDLGILFSDGGDYYGIKTGKIKRIINEENADDLIGVTNGLFLIDRVKLSDGEENAITAFAGIVIKSGMTFENDNIVLKKPVMLRSVKPMPFAADDSDVKVENGVFRNDRFIIKSTPLLPWCNIIAKDGFGTMVSDSSPGYTWFKNSRENRITPWSNDTSTDNRGEMLIMKVGSKYYELLKGARCTFGRNFAVYEGIAGSISFKVTVSVLKNHESKYVTVNLTNLSSSRVEISLSYYTEPCLGTDRKNNGCVKFSRTSFGISFKNPFNSGFKCIAELSSDRVPDSIVTDKFSFLCGDWSMSDLIPKKHCCAAVVNKIVLDGDSSDSVSYFLTCSENGESVTDLTLEKFTVQNRIRINSSDEYLNILFNYWLPLQIKNDRMLARTGFYQSSGAYGFRDQLQDSKALLLIDPAICRNHIIKCCSRQFFEGDVLHWWHEYDGAVKGVRTRCSDDKLWLADAVYDYVEKTGDAEILEIKVPYISGERLEENEIEKYEVCLIDESRCESVYEHVLKAVKSVSFGSHNLALIGSCDWNDGFSNVGVKGLGESVWLSMFLADIYRKTAVLAEIMNDPVNYGKFTERSDELKRYIDESCWDGEWYIRAFHDNGETVGSSNDDSCKIDLLPQAFATICDMPDTQRKESALDSCIKYLYDEKIGIVKLFSPPYSDTSKIGYVGAYPEGIRENGGQYTHAAVWFDIALFKAKRAEEGYKILRLLNPAFRSAEKPFSQVFLTEPYSMPADIYDNISCRGRGGWTHYTGAAGWMYKCIFENLYGISVLNDRMAVNPCFPKGFTPGNIEIEIKNTKINVDFVYSETVDCGDNSMLIVDGAVSDFIPIDGKRHFATVKFKNNIE